MLIWISRIFGIAAAAILASDILGWMASGSFRLTALGEWWFWAHKDSLQVLQPAIERHTASNQCDDLIIQCDRIIQRIMSPGGRC